MMVMASSAAETKSHCDRAVLGSSLFISYTRRLRKRSRSMRRRIFTFALMFHRRLIELNQNKPMNPNTTIAAPATINQCGYSIAESHVISTWPSPISHDGAAFLNRHLESCFETRVF
jgi:hypothetical protein